MKTEKGITLIVLMAWLGIASVFGIFIISTYSEDLSKYSRRNNYTNNGKMIAYVLKEYPLIDIINCGCVEIIKDCDDCGEQTYIIGVDDILCWFVGEDTHNRIIAITAICNKSSCAPRDYMIMTIRN